MLVYFITNYLPWILSTLSISVQYLAGNKNLMAWVISIPLQILWVIWIVTTGSWGFLPLNICMTLVSIRNLIKWSIDSINDGFETYIPYEDIDTE